MITERRAVRVTRLDRNGTWLVALEGEHDIATTPLLTRQTDDIWPRCTVAVVDLSAATFIDCSVVGWLVHSRDALNGHGSGTRALRIVESLSASTVQRVFEVLCLRDAFNCYATRRDALAGGSCGGSDPPVSARLIRPALAVQRSTRCWSSSSPPPSRMADAPRQSRP